MLILFTSLLRGDAWKESAQPAFLDPRRAEEAISKTCMKKKKILDTVQSPTSSLLCKGSRFQCGWETMKIGVLRVHMTHRLTRNESGRLLEISNDRRLRSGGSWKPSGSSRSWCLWSSSEAHGSFEKGLGLAEGGRWQGAYVFANSELERILF